MIESPRVALDYGTSAAKNLAALRDGTVDVITVAITPLVWDVLRDDTPGQPGDPVILASLASARTALRVVSFHATATPDPASLAGQRVAVQHGSIGHFIWHLFTVAHDLDPADVTLIDMDLADVPAALADGRVDAAVLSAPRVAQISNGTKMRVTFYPVSGLKLSRWLLVARRSAVLDQPQTIDMILQGYLDAVDWISHNSMTPAEEIARDWGMSGAEAGILADGLLYQVSLDWSLYRSFREQLNWAAELTGTDVHAAPRGFPDLVAPAPLARLRPDAVRLPPGIGAWSDRPRP